MPNKQYSNRTDLREPAKWKTPFVLSFAYTLIAFALLALTSWINKSAGLPGLILPSIYLIGVLFLVIGFDFRYSAFKRIFRLNNSFHPKYAPEHLITGGVFGISRNPAYLGILLMFFGAFLLDINLLMAIVLILAFIRLNQMAGYEERVLAKKFGKSYSIYRGKVRRWI